MNNEKHGNTWDEWARHVLNELKRLTAVVEAQNVDIQMFKIEIASKIASKIEVAALRDHLSNEKTNRIESVTITREKLTQLLNNQKDETKENITLTKAELIKNINEINNRHNIEITRLTTELKLKAGLWGALSGAVPIIFIFILKFAEQLVI